MLLAILLMATAIPGLSFAQPSISSEIAPTGTLRVAASLSTSVLLARTSDGKVTGGVASNVRKFIAEKLGVLLELVTYSNADTYSQSFGKGEWDIGFGSRTPLVADKADLSSIGWYLADVLTNFIVAKARRMNYCASQGTMFFGGAKNPRWHETVGRNILNA